MDQIHFAITRHVKPGMEREFEAQLREFARQSLAVPGTTGVHMIGPVPGSGGCDYGILRSFKDEAASREFYNSELFHEWQKRVEPLVIGEAVRWKVHGLEAFFRDTHRSPPPRWKMAILTWFGVFPTVLVWSLVVPFVVGELHWVAHMAITNALVVATLAWITMPLLTRFFSSWLQREQVVGA